MTWTLLAAAPSNPRMIACAGSCLTVVNMLPGGVTVNPGVYQFGDASHPANGSGAGPSWKTIGGGLVPQSQGGGSTFHVGAVRIRKYGSTLYCVVGTCQVGSAGDVIDAGLTHYPIIVGKSTDGGATWDFRGVGRTQGTGWVNDIAHSGTPNPFYLIRDVAPATNYDLVVEAGMGFDGHAANWTGIDQDPLDAAKLYASGRSGAWRCTNLLDVFTGGTPVFYPIVHGIFGGEDHDILWDQRWNGYAYIGVSDWRMAGSSDGFAADANTWHSDPGGNDNVESLAQNATSGRLYCGFNNAAGASGGLMSIADPASYGGAKPPAGDWITETTTGDALDTALASNPVSGLCVFADDGSGHEVVLVALQNEGLYRRVGRSGTWALVTPGPFGFKGQTTDFARLDDGTGRCAVHNRNDGLWVSSDYGASWTYLNTGNASTTGANGVEIAPDGTMYCVDSQHVRKITNAWSGSPTIVTMDTGLTLTGTTPPDRTGVIGLKPDGSVLYMVNRAHSGQVGFLVQYTFSGAGSGTWVEPPGRARHPDGLFQTLKMSVHQDGRILFVLDGQACRRGMWPASGNSVDLSTVYGGGYDQACGVDPITDGVVNVGADTGGTYYSSDHGATFTPTGHSSSASDALATSDRDIIAVYPHPSVSGRWYKLTKAGHWQSDDGGQTWHDTLGGGVGPSLNPSAGGGGHPRNVGKHAGFLADGSHLVGASGGTIWSRANDASIAAGVTTTPWVAVTSPTGNDITGLAVDDDGATVFVADGHSVWSNGGVPSSVVYQVYADAAGAVMVGA